MAVLSGVKATLNGFDTVRNWKVKRTMPARLPRASNTNGTPAGLFGNKDWSGSADFYGIIPATLPGATFTFTGAISSAAATTAWTGSAIMKSLRLKIDIEAAEPISGTIEFEGNGELTATSSTVTDSVAPAIYPSKGMKANFAGSDINDIRTMELLLESDNKPYVSSSTAGITLRVAGNKSASGSFTQYEATSASVLAYGTTGQLKYYVTASTFWDIKWAMLEDNDPSGLRETGDLAGLTYNWKWAEWTDVAVAGTFAAGYLKTPAAATWA